MTSRTVHHIDADELRTFRLTCKHCKTITVIDVKTWVPKRGAGVLCPNCNASWEKAGDAVFAVVHGLRALHALNDANKPPIGLSQVTPGPYVRAEAEIVEKP